MGVFKWLSVGRENFGIVEKMIREEWAKVSRGVGERFYREVGTVRRSAVFDGRCLFLFIYFITTEPTGGAIAVPTGIKRLYVHV